MAGTAEAIAGPSMWTRERLKETAIAEAPPEFGAEAADLFASLLVSMTAFFHSSEDGWIAWVTPANSRSDTRIATFLKDGTLASATISGLSGKKAVDPIAALTKAYVSSTPWPRDSGESSYYMYRSPALKAEKTGRGAIISAAKAAKITLLAQATLEEGFNQISEAAGQAFRSRLDQNVLELLKDHREIDYYGWFCAKSIAPEVRERRLAAWTSLGRLGPLVPKKQDIASKVDEGADPIRLFAAEAGVSTRVLKRTINLLSDPKTEWGYRGLRGDNEQWKETAKLLEEVSDDTIRKVGSVGEASGWVEFARKIAQLADPDDKVAQSEMIHKLISGTNFSRGDSAPGGMFSYRTGCIETAIETIARRVILANAELLGKGEKIPLIEPNLDDCRAGVINALVNRLSLHGFKILAEMDYSLTAGCRMATALSHPGAESFHPIFDAVQDQHYQLKSVTSLKDLQSLENWSFSGQAISLLYSMLDRGLRVFTMHNVNSRRRNDGPFAIVSIPQAELDGLFAALKDEVDEPPPPEPDWSNWQRRSEKEVWQAKRDRSVWSHLRNSNVSSFHPNNERIAKEAVPDLLRLAAKLPGIRKEIKAAKAQDRLNAAEMARIEALPSGYDVSNEKAYSLVHSAVHSIITRLRLWDDVTKFIGDVIPYIVLRQHRRRLKSLWNEAKQQDGEDQIPPSILPFVLTHSFLKPDLAEFWKRMPDEVASIAIEFAPVHLSETDANLYHVPSDFYLELASGDVINFDIQTLDCLMNNPYKFWAFLTKESRDSIDPARFMVDVIRAIPKLFSYSGPPERVPLKALFSKGSDEGAIEWQADVEGEAGADLVATLGRHLIGSASDLDEFTFQLAARAIAKGHVVSDGFNEIDYSGRAALQSRFKQAPIPSPTELTFSELGKLLSPERLRDDCGAYGHWIEIWRKGVIGIFHAALQRTATDALGGSDNGRRLNGLLAPEASAAAVEKLRDIPSVVQEAYRFLELAHTIYKDDLVSDLAERASA